MDARWISLHAVIWGCRIATMLRGSGAALERVLDGVASTALSPQDRQALTVDVYDRQLRFRRAGPFAWEPPWWEADLPSAPARILVGGCGTGREVRALLDRGYRVWAFDPSPVAVAACRRANPDAEHVECFDYATLSRRPDAGTSAVHPSDLPFDAALLGWGSLSHLLAPSEHVRLFEALARLCPGGPILASFFLLDSSWPRDGRARRLGLRLGRWLAEARETVGPEARKMRLLAHAGFVYAFEQAELEHLAEACGRELRMYRDSYPHATFRVSR